MAADRAVEIEGLTDFRRELRRVHTDLPKEMRDFNKTEVADPIAAHARTYASSMGGVHAKAAGAIKGYATAVQASVGFSTSGGSHPEAPVAFWGAKKHTGWYSAGRYSTSPSQHPEWVGNTWTPGQRGQGPYAINDAVADAVDELPAKYGQMIERLAAKAFPD